MGICVAFAHGSAGVWAVIESCIQTTMSSALRCVFVSKTTVVCLPDSKTRR